MGSGRRSVPVEDDQDYFTEEADVVLEICAVTCIAWAVVSLLAAA